MFLNWRKKYIFFSSCKDNGNIGRRGHYHHPFRGEYDSRCGPSSRPSAHPSSSFKNLWSIVHLSKISPHRKSADSLSSPNPKHRSRHLLRTSIHGKTTRFFTPFSIRSIYWKEDGRKGNIYSWVEFVINFYDRNRIWKNFICVCQLEFFFFFFWKNISKYNKRNSMDPFEFWTWF